MTTTLVSSHKAHPWHGVVPGDRAPDVVNAYIELVPTDTVKYEVDKEYGILRLDRPQKFSNQCPTLYGFIPQTYCGLGVGSFCSARIGEPNIEGDGDPLDICVLTERPVGHGDILVRAIPIGGLRMIDGGKSDDKIIAVLQDDGVFGDWREISACPAKLIDRLRHYFLTYKLEPDSIDPRVRITDVFDAEEAKKIIGLACEDYDATFRRPVKVAAE